MNFFQIAAVLAISLVSRSSSCSSDLSGSSSKQAKFEIDFFSPLSYTYPPENVERVTGQSLTADMAKTAINNDLNLAISQAMVDNMLALASPPVINFTFTPPKLLIDNGDICKTDGTYIAVSGTVIYKCYVGNGASGTTSSGSTGPTSTLATTLKKEDYPFRAGEDTTTVVTTVATTTGSSGTGTSGTSGTSTSGPVSTNVKSTPFDQKLTITATISQALFESQWKKISRSVQKALESKNVIFNDDIAVTILTTE